jgi:hypothetical protein
LSRWNVEFRYWHSDGAALSEYENRFAANRMVPNSALLTIAKNQYHASISSSEPSALATLADLPTSKQVVDVVAELPNPLPGLVAQSFLATVIADVIIRSRRVDQPPVLADEQPNQPSQHSVCQFASRLGFSAPHYDMLRGF